MRKSVFSVGFLFVVLVILSFSTRNVSAPTNTSILIGTSDGSMSGTDHQATFLITVVNNDPLDHHVFLTLETPVLPSGSVWASPPARVNALPLGWTYSFSPSEFDVGHGQSVQSTLTITGTAGTDPGLKPIKVTGYWIAYVIDDPIHDAYASANVNSFVTVMVKLMVPEYLLGTILGLVGMFAAFGAYYFQKRKQFNP